MHETLFRGLTMTKKISAADAVRLMSTSDPLGPVWYNAT